ncbi:hypothetical protein GCM10011317_26910 [Niveispirillum cyanobacteriorum]|nr:hypothetical protein GCM10011317_26910 [Niveispirillum cyanobacteriorum]
MADENSRLKKLLAKAMLDNTMLREFAGKSGEACGSTPDDPLPITAPR